MGRHRASPGTASFLGARLLRRLVAARGADAVLAVDIAPPPTTLSGVRHRMVDLTSPASDQRLLEVFREEEVDTVVHTAFFTSPRRDATYAHELESIGTLNLLAAAAAAGVRHVVLRSFTAVYGARGQNPSFLTEERALHAESRPRLGARQAGGGAARGLLRAPLPGPGRDRAALRAAVRPRRAHLLHAHLRPARGAGADGLRPAGAAPASRRRARRGDAGARARPRAGAFNVVPARRHPAARPRSTWPTRCPLPVPHPVAYPPRTCCGRAGVGRRARAGSSTTCAIPFVADGEKARRELGFTARHSSRDALDAYLAIAIPRRARRRPRARARPTRASWRVSGRRRSSRSPRPPADGAAERRPRRAAASSGSRELEQRAPSAARVGRGARACWWRWRAP